MNQVIVKLSKLIFQISSCITTICFKSLFFLDYLDSVKCIDNNVAKKKVNKTKQKETHKHLWISYLL